MDRTDEAEYYGMIWNAEKSHELIIHCHGNTFDFALAMQSPINALHGAQLCKAQIHSPISRTFVLPPAHGVAALGCSRARVARRGRARHGGAALRGGGAVGGEADP